MEHGQNKTKEFFSVLLDLQTSDPLSPRIFSMYIYLFIQYTINIQFNYIVFNTPASHGAPTQRMGCLGDKHNIKIYNLTFSLNVKYFFMQYASIFFG